MKKILVLSALGVASAVLLTGCVAAVGSGPKTTVIKPTLGQQLIDLQNARNTGALTEVEYQQQKLKLLEAK